MGDRGLVHLIQAIPMKTNTVTIKNSDTGKTESISQDSFNRYMSMTNGEVLQRIIKDD